MSIDPPIPEIKHFQNLTLKIQGQGQMTMMLHNYRSSQFHRTLNGINPSSSFRDMVSTKSGPSAAWLTSFWPMGKPIWCKWANNYDSAQLQVETNSNSNSKFKFKKLLFKKIHRHMLINHETETHEGLFASLFHGLLLHWQHFNLC